MLKISRFLGGLPAIVLIAPCLAQSRPRIVLPGDLLEIVCSDDGELCVSRIVNPDGKILLPTLGPVGVATLTPEAIQIKLKEILRQQTGKADVQVEVRPTYLPGQAVSIDGAVKTPITFRFQHPLTLSKVLADAQPTDFADLYQIEISHADGTSALASVNDPIVLRMGDRIHVPIASKSHSVEVIGGVNKPSQLDFRSGMTLAEAVQNAGGIALRGNSSRILVERMGEQVPVSLPVDSQFPLVLGDRVRVEVSPEIAHVVVNGDIAHPGLVDLIPGMTLSEAIQANGSPLRGDETVWLKRASARGYLKPVKLSFRLVSQKRLPDPILFPDDIVQVGASDLKSNK